MEFVLLFLVPLFFMSVCTLCYCLDRRDERRGGKRYESQRGFAVLSPAADEQD
ncbi:MAG: hypothetical protein JWO87_1636 [Phycisphaerales bacterium]|nr:hypothetical protein [Phycisphaerales bacterium]